MPVQLKAYVAFDEGRTTDAPAGANEALATLARGAGGDLHAIIALNDRIADGTDVSWIWDVDWELIAASLGRVVATGSRAPSPRTARERSPSSNSSAVGLNIAGRSARAR